MNNFVVYEGFFASQQNNSDVDGRRMHITASPNTNLFGPTFTSVQEQRRRSNSQPRVVSQVLSPLPQPPVVVQPPVGRYAAKRPSCSMAQIIHNSPTTVSTEPNSTPSSTNNHHAPPSASNNNDDYVENGNHYDVDPREFEEDQQQQQQRRHHHRSCHRNGLQDPEDDENPEPEGTAQGSPATTSNGGDNAGDDDHVAAAAARSSGTLLDDEVLSANLQNLALSDEVDYHHHHQQQQQQQVTFAQEYADIPKPASDPDPYSFHPHQLELEDTNRENSASPQSISQQHTPEHPAGVPRLRAPLPHNKQHTGLKNISFGVGSAVTPCGKMEFEQEQDEGFGTVKIGRPIGKSGTRHSLHSGGDGDNESVYSKNSDSSHITDHGHFDLKFYHNKLW
ncbi:alpha-tubulin N-acetyltransferase-like [Uranotaenia lowii]|uniref:alpha-tubulin N-acetyltransferase-like n=1 Tax=Uranotaenia lowii TaxID=190385 RepID=UPI002479EB26|nr:alpha-tubulin N-acetyltransferase-like [Uranotaenia lowii]